jgi:hypothetical protein
MAPATTMGGVVLMGTQGAAGQWVRLWYDNDASKRVSPGDTLVGQTTSAADGAYTFADVEWNHRYVTEVIDAVTRCPSGEKEWAPPGYPASPPVNTWEKAVDVATQ